MDESGAYGQVGHLIDKQIRQWELRRRLAEYGGEMARRELAHLSEGPWVTISKQLGCRGTVLAKRLAERLGWQIFDKEILEAISRETHTRDRILSALDEHAVGAFKEYVAHLIVPDHLAQAAFVHEMVKVIWALGRHGRAIVLGRGANWVLDPRFGLRVRAVASLESRIARLTEIEKLDRAAAERRIREDDAAKAAFVRKFYNRDIEDPLGYDLVLNMDAMDISVAADIALAALRHKLESGPEREREESAP